jgi:hypothetical protein
MADAVPCPTCAVDLPPASRFCPHCGTRLAAVGETVEMNPDPVLSDPADGHQVSPRISPPTVHRAHRRPAGIHPVPLAGGLAALTLVAAIILLATGSLVAGLILLGLAVALLTLFAGGVRRHPEEPSARLTLTAADRLRALTRFVAVTARAWGRASLDLLRIHGRRHRLRRELNASLAPLGKAVHQDDRQSAEALKRQTADLEQKLQATEREARAAVAAARQEIDYERKAIEPTEALRRVDMASAENGRDL